MLRYFLRLEPEFGAKAVEASLAARKKTGCYRFLLQELGDALPKVEPLAISALDDTDLEVANDAGGTLGNGKRGIGVVGTAETLSPRMASP